MTVAKAPAPERPPASSASLVRRAAWTGFLAWIPLAVAGQILAWTAYVITRSFRPWSWVKVGLANTIAVARVPFEARAEAPAPVAAEGSLIGMTSMRLTVALGAGTIVMLVLLFRAGRAALRGVPRRPGLAVGATVAVALGFAVPMLLSALLVTLRFPSIGIGVLRPIAWAAFVLPFVVASVAAGAGAVSAGSSTDDTGRVGAVARGAWHAMTWGIVLALLGTVALAAFRPAGSTSYARALERQGDGGAVLAMYHALLLPNQSVDVLATSMGSCTEFSFGGDTSRVCLGGIDVADPLLALLVGEPAGDGTTTIAFGPAYLAFLLVPAIATIAGGRRAAEGQGQTRERAFRAACAGVGFGVLVGVAAWAATITIEGSEGDIASLGAAPVGTGALGVVWGVVGGALGAIVPDRPVDLRSRRSSRATPR